jgi:hypothetical protein
MSNRQRQYWEHQSDDVEEFLSPVREEWEYQDDEDDGCRDIAYTAGDWAHQQQWAEDEPSSLAYTSATKAYARTWDDSAELRQLPYPQYLLSRHWKITRQRALLRAGRQCHRCCSSYRLEVHHLTYENLGRELEDDLVVLCANCHADAHGLPS